MELTTSQSKVDVRMSEMINTYGDSGPVSRATGDDGGIGD